MGKEILSSKINLFEKCQRLWPSGMPACHIDERGSILSGDMNFFYFFLLNNLNKGIFYKVISTSDKILTNSNERSLLLKLARRCYPR